MGLPKENPEGYKDSSPVNFAADLHGRLLEVHGTSDDNVHMQNTIAMINALIEAGKIRPVIEKVFPLDQIAEAHRVSEQGHVRGKLVVKISS